MKIEHAYTVRITYRGNGAYESASMGRVAVVPGEQLEALSSAIIIAIGGIESDPSDRVSVLADLVATTADMDGWMPESPGHPHAAELSALVDAARTYRDAVWDAAKFRPPAAPTEG